MALRLRIVALSLCAGLLAACGTTYVAQAPSRDAASAARLALEDAALRGPVLLETRGHAFDQSDVARNASLTEFLANGVDFSELLFTTDRAEAADTAFYVVALLNPATDVDPTRACTNAPGGAPVAGAAEILLVACERGRPIGSALGRALAAGPADFRYTDMLRWTAAALFPDDYRGVPAFAGA